MTRLIEFCANLWIYELETPSFVVRAAVIKGEKRAAVFDTLSLPEEAAPLAAVLDGMPFYVVYSHGDYDHAWGTAGLGESHLGVVAHAECLRRARCGECKWLSRASGTACAWFPQTSHSHLVYRSIWAA